ncbi:hypothetical protein SFRURICE_006254 [Spodoptera frugiperda]|nr:hypothetical protein SFRURICE_006254 [Spodoptera frugiperda]
MLKHFILAVKLRPRKTSTWNIINNETGRNKPRNVEFNLYTENGRISTNLKVAQEFESFFKNIPLKTTEALKSSASLSIELLKSNVKECTSDFRFQYTNPQAVIKAFKDIKVKSTEDLWGMSDKNAWRQAGPAPQGNEKIKLRGRLDALRPDVSAVVRSAQERQVAAAGGMPHALAPTDTVLARDYSARGGKWLPGTIVEQTGPVSYKVDGGRNCTYA